MYFTYGETELSYLRQKASGSVRSSTAWALSAAR